MQYDQDKLASLAEKRWRASRSLAEIGRSEIGYKKWKEARGHCQELEEIAREMTTLLLDFEIDEEKRDRALLLKADRDELNLRFPVPRNAAEARAALVSVRVHLDSLESFVIQGKLPDSLEVADVDEREPCAV